MDTIRKMVSGRFGGEISQNLKAVAVMERFNRWLEKEWPDGKDKVRPVFVQRKALMIEFKHPAYGARIKEREEEIIKALEPAVERLAFRLWVEK
ncbi:MAG: hypothetical protein V1707_00920 [bacterium]